MPIDLLRIRHMNPTIRDLGFEMFLGAIDGQYGGVALEPKVTRRPKRVKGKAKILVGVSRPESSRTVNGKEIDRPQNSTIALDIRTVAFHAAMQKAGKVLSVGGARKIGRRLGLGKRSVGQRIRALESAGRVIEVKNNGSREDHVLKIV